MVPVSSSSKTKFARILAVCRRILVSTILVSLFFVLIQDFLVFPGLWAYPTRWFSAPSAPPGEVRHEISSADGTTIEVYEYQANPRLRPYVAIMSHGNGQSAPAFAAFQQWLGSLGITSYMMEYRGYGHSGGWPSEEKLYADAAATWDFVTAREKIDGEDVIVVGHSIGSGVAAWLAAARNPAVLMLISGYSSLAERAKDEPLLGFLAPYFLRYKFPSTGYLATLTDTCVVLAHGKQDSVIGFKHQARLHDALAPGVRSVVMVSDESGHNDLLFRAHKDMSRALLSCLE